MLVGDAVTFRNDGEAVVHQDLTCSHTCFSFEHNTIFKTRLVYDNLNILNLFRRSISSINFKFNGVVGRASTRVDHRIGSVSLCLLLKQLVHFLTAYSKSINTSCCNQLQCGLATFSPHYVEDNIVEVEVTSLRSRQILSNHAIERITTFETWTTICLLNFDIRLT